MPRYVFPAKDVPASDKALRNEHIHTRPSLERNYPRVLEAVLAMWGHRELNTYFNKLTMDDRGGREGFPPEVWDEIYMLQRLHQEIVPDQMQQSTFRLR